MRGLTLLDKYRRNAMAERRLTGGPSAMGQIKVRRWLSEIAAKLPPHVVPAYDGLSVVVGEASRV